MRNGYFRLIVAFAVSLLLVPAARAADPYAVGVLISITGHNAPLGTAQRDALMMIEGQVNQRGGINGHALKLIIEDDASDNVTAIKAARKLIDQDNVCAIIGGSSTGASLAVATLVEDSGVPLISMAAGSAITHPVRPWTFRAAPTDVQALTTILDYLSDMKIGRLAMLHDSNAFGTSGRDQLRLLVPTKYKKMRIVFEEPFASNAEDMRNPLERIRATDAQAILCWGTSPVPARVARDARGMGIKLPLIMSPGAAHQAFLDAAGIAANGVLLPAGTLLLANELPRSDWRKSVMLQFAKDFQTKYNRPADPFGGHARDALNIVIEALKKNGDNRAQLRTAIEHTENLVGIGGIYCYLPENHDGPTDGAFVMVKVIDGKWIKARRDTP